MSWIKMRSNLTNDPDVIAVAADLSMDEFSVVGRLHAFWSWADQHSADGTLPRATSAFVDRLTACPGFAEALRRVGWLDGRDSALILPNWERHNGETAKGRAVEARRKAKYRSGTNVTDSVPQKVSPDKSREDQSSEACASSRRVDAGSLFGKALMLKVGALYGRTGLHEWSSHEADALMEHLARGILTDDALTVVRRYLNALAKDKNRSRFRGDMRTFLRDPQLIIDRARAEMPPTPSKPIPGATSAHDEPERPITEGERTQLREKTRADIAKIRGGRTA